MEALPHLTKPLMGLMFNLRQAREEDYDFVNRGKNIAKKDDVERLSDYSACHILIDKITGERVDVIWMDRIMGNAVRFYRKLVGTQTPDACEGLDLICQFAFDTLKLKKIEVADGEFDESSVGTAQEIETDFYRQHLKYQLQERIECQFIQRLASLFGVFEFHHIAVACKNLNKEADAYKMLGYRQESPDFRDDCQGIYGRFLVSQNFPRLELLRNTEESHTLDIWLKNRTKMYHTAYIVGNFDKAMEVFRMMGAQVVREPRPSTYFKKRISFLLLPNLSLIELIEKEPTDE